LAARRWFGERAALFAVGIGAFLPLLWWASQEVRMYNTLALAVLVMALGLVRLLEADPPRWAWIALWGGELAALYTHNTGVVVVGAANLVALGGWLWQAARGERRWGWLRLWLAGQIAVCVLWLPELAMRFAAVSGANAPIAAPAYSLDVVWQSWQALWAGSWNQVLLDDFVWIASVLLLPLAVFGLLSLRLPRGRVLLGLSAALYGVLLVALAVLGVHFHGRYLVMLAPLLIIAITAGTEYAMQRWRFVARLWPVGVIVIVLTFYATAGNMHRVFQHDDARAMVAYYADVLGPDDLVLAWSYAERYELLYYLDQIGRGDQLVTLPEGDSLEAVVPLINARLPESGSTQVALNTWYTQRAPEQGRLACLLAHDQPTRHESETVIAMSSDVFTLDGPLTLPDPAAVEPVDFGALRLAAVGSPADAIPAHHAICLPLTLELTTPTDIDIRAAVSLRNRLGWEIERQDVTLDVLGFTTSQLAPGAEIDAALLLTLPTFTPPGEYALWLRLYDGETLAGLDVRDPASGAPTGQDVPIGTLDIAPGTWEAISTSCGLTVAPGLVLTNCDTGNLDAEQDVFCPMLAGDAVDPAACHAFAAIPAPTAGEALHFTLRWHIEGEPPPITLTLRGDDWEISDTWTPPVSGPVLDWRELRIPADASGGATLTLQVGAGDPLVVGEYPIMASEHVMSAPAVGVQSGVDFPALGTLYGYTLEADTLRNGEDFALTLAWQAEAATDLPYTVTAQLLDVDGRVIAQHDGQPSDGVRPTTGWVAGEFITDRHTLRFRPEAADYTGAARLIVAVYDAASGTRLPTRAGTDHAALTADLSVALP
ncbi:MAG: hypothetical protein JW910_15400, partial [Anaerolineae bacterium]|nr:hypothetical protein [Anaerolineae bacterium]